MSNTKITIVTAALPYANGDIHAGHLVEYVQVDIHARHLRMEGEICYYVCADDAHGAPIQIRAEQERVTPTQLIDEMHAAHKRDFERFSIGFDVYHSTHSQENRDLVSDIFKRLERKGAIFARDVRQLYDPEEGRFLADRYVRGKCPRCSTPDQYGDACEACGATYDALDLIDPVAVRTGAAPEARSSEHLFFDLPRFEAFLQTWRRQTGLQPGINNKLDEWFEQGLRPWDISRDAPYFGFEIPGHPDKFFYVWLDAPIGYLASFKHLCDRLGIDFEAFLSDPDVDLIHFIGKDIAYFHTLFWPAMLHAAGKRLPSSVFCHGFLTVNGRKMSKSRGTLISAAHLADALDPDFFRFFVFSMLGEGLDDIDLNFTTFKERTNADLIGKIINIGSRCAKLLHDTAGGRLSAKLPDNARFDASLAELADVRTLVRARRYSSACRRLIALAEKTNQWLAVHAPWKLAKGSSAEIAAASAIVSQALLEYRALMIMLAPVTPSLSARALKLFIDKGMRPESPLYADLDARARLGEIAIAPFEPLLTWITDEQLQSLTPSAPLMAPLGAVESQRSKS